ncbi:MAG: hypothetical protein QOG99_346 [Frankiales bacterium]|jgi:hypothetical protein|nr:hypothetical protein [Frankiales bacterium]
MRALAITLAPLRPTIRLHVATIRHLAPLAVLRSTSLGNAAASLAELQRTARDAEEARRAVAEAGSLPTSSSGTA